MRSGDSWTNKIGLLLGLLLCTTGLMWPAGVLAADEAAARDLAQSSGCFKCHGVDKKKDGPAFRDSAAKYKDDPDAPAYRAKRSELRA
jgi:cytochrome c